jgi:protein-tyrosine-phosphatase
MSDPKRPLRILFLCRDNSCRSIMAEAILSAMNGPFEAYSAGSHPIGRIDPQTRSMLSALGHDMWPLRSKSWAEFATTRSMEMDFVFTVCDRAVGEQCPAWPGQPITAHWSVADPTTAEGNEAQRGLALREAYVLLTTRLSVFVNLPFASLDRMALANRVSAIGRMRTLQSTDNLVA